MKRRKARQLAAEQELKVTHERQAAELKELQKTYYEACGMQPASMSMYAEWLSSYLNEGYHEVYFVPSIDWTQFSVATKSPTFSLPPIYDEQVRYLLVPADVDVEALQTVPFSVDGATGYSVYEDWGDTMLLGRSEDSTVYFRAETIVVCSPEVIPYLTLSRQGWNNLEAQIDIGWGQRINDHFGKTSEEPYVVSLDDRHNHAVVNRSVRAWKRLSDTLPGFIREQEELSELCHSAIIVAKVM